MRTCRSSCSLILFAWRHSPSCFAILAFISARSMSHAFRARSWLCHSIWRKRMTPELLASARARQVGVKVRHTLQCVLGTLGSMVVARLGGIRGVVEHAARLLVCHGSRSRAASTSSALSRRRSLLLCRGCCALGCLKHWRVGGAAWRLPVLTRLERLSSSWVVQCHVRVDCANLTHAPRAPLRVRTSTKHIHRLNTQALRNNNSTPLFTFNLFPSCFSTEHRIGSYVLAISSMLAVCAVP